MPLAIIRLQKLRSARTQLGYDSARKLLGIMFESGAASIAQGQVHNRCQHQVCLGASRHHANQQQLLNKARALPEVYYLCQQHQTRHAGASATLQHSSPLPCRSANGKAWSFMFLCAGAVREQRADPIFHKCAEKRADHGSAYPGRCHGTLLYGRLRRAGAALCT